MLNKSAKTILAGTILIAVVVLFSFVFLPKLISSEESYPSNMSVLIKTNLTDNQVKAIGPDYIVYNTTNETGRSEVIFFSGTIATTDANGTYQFFTNLSNVTYANYLLNITFPDATYYTYHPYVTVGSTEYNLSDFLTNYPSAKQKLYIYDEQADWHIYFNFTDVTGINITSFRLERDELDCGVVTNTSDTITYSSAYNFDFSDLVLNNFTLDSLAGCTNITIGNITSDKINNSAGNGTLILDPVLTLQGVGYDLKDSLVQEGNPDINYGSEDFLSIGNGGSEQKERTYISFNLATLPTSSIINFSNLSLYVSELDDTLNTSLHEVYNWTNSSSSNELSETQITWNNQPCGTNFDNDTNCNLTSEYNLTLTSGFFGWKNWSAKNIVQRNVGNNVSFAIKLKDESSVVAAGVLSSKEDVITSRRPKLIIDYTLGNATNTSCGYVNSDLNLSANISNNYGDCLIVNASNIIIDCRGYWITTGSGGTGIYGSNPFNNATIKNCFISSNGHGIYFYNNSNNTIFNTSSNNVGAIVNKWALIFAYNSKNNNVSFSNFTSNNQIAVVQTESSASGNNFTNIRAIGSGSHTRGISIIGRNNVIRNSFVNTTGDFGGISLAGNSTLYDTYIESAGTTLQGGSGINNATNVTFSSSSSSGTLNIFWYLETQVNNTGGNGINQANVTAKTTSGTLSNYSLTDATGLTSRLTLREYFQNATSKYYDTNYTINASKSGAYNSTQVNLTTNKVDSNKIFLTLSLSPQITFSGSTPENNSYLAINVVMINVTTSLDSDFCNLSWDGVNETMDVLSSTSFGRIKTGVADGSYIYKVYCNSTESGLWGISETRTVYIDTTDPLIDYASNNPENASWSSSTSQTFNATITEANKDTVTFWINSTGNSTVTCTGSSPNYICPKTVTLSNGAYRYRFYVNDSAGKVNSTDIRTIYIDTTSPSINIVSPTSGFRYNTQSIWFNITTTNIASWCGYSLDGNENVTLTNSTGNWNDLNSSMTEATHSVIFYCNNSAGTRTSSGPRTFYVDASNPLATFGTNPADEYLSSSSTVIFDLKCSDNIAISSIQLYGNWSGTWKANYSNNSMSSYNNTWINKTVTGIPDGHYKWSIRCNDTTNNIDWETNRTFTVNTATPAITINSPTSSYYYKTASTWFNITTTSSSVWCGYSLDDSVNITMSGSGTSWYAQNTSMTDGTHLVNFTCNNSVGFRTYAGPRTFYIDTTPPKFTNLPINNTYSNTNKPTISVTITEANAPSQYFSAVDIGYPGLSRNNRTLICPPPNPYDCYWTSIVELEQTNSTHFYTFWIWGNDSATNFNSTSIYRLYIDTINPGIEFVPSTPANNTFSANNYLTVNVSLDDLELSFGNYTFNLYYSNKSLYNSTNHSSQSDTSINWTNIPEGKYYYNVSEIDLAGNNNHTETRVWTYDNTNPLINYTSPTILNDNSSSRNLIIKVNYTEVNPLKALLNITEVSTGNYVYYTNSSIPSGSNNITFNVNSLSYGNYTFYVKLNDTAGHSVQTETAWVFVNATTPRIVLISPADNTITKTTRFDFICNASTAGSGLDAPLENVSLWTNRTGVWEINETKAIGGLTQFNFSNKAIPDNNYTIWNCQACDTDGVCDMYSFDNYSIITDNTSPSISYSAESDTAGQFTRKYILLNLTATDSLAGIDEVIGSWTGINYSKKLSTLACSGSYCIKNFTDLTDANYTVYGWTNDSAGNINGTGAPLRNFQIDAEGPTITITYPESTEEISTSSLPLVINMTYTITDNVALDICKYNVTDQEGSLVFSNNSIPCSSTYSTFSINTAGSYYINLFSNTTNHQTISTRLFIVSYSSTPVPPTGGGGTENQTKPAVCGNSICEAGEDWENCQRDCARLNVDFLLKTDWWKWILIGLLILVVIFLLLRQRKKKKR